MRLRAMLARLSSSFLNARHTVFLDSILLSAGGSCSKSLLATMNPCGIMSFGTRVGYFRQKDRTLEHVYGVHYDCAHQQIGHPLFHAQMGPQGHFAGNINGYFRQNWQLKDYITPVLRTVRSPSAGNGCILGIRADLCRSLDVGGVGNDYNGRVREDTRFVRVAWRCG